MQFATQHVKIKGKGGYNFHRQGDTTWKTDGKGFPFEVVKHASVAIAANDMNQRVQCGAAL